MLRFSKRSRPLERGPASGLAQRVGTRAASRSSAMGPDVKNGVIGMIRPGLMVEAVGVSNGGNLGYPALSAGSKLKFEAWCYGLGICGVRDTSPLMCRTHYRN